MKTQVYRLAAVAALGLGLSACGSSYSPSGPGGGPGTPTPAATPTPVAGTAQVMISNFAFAPSTLTVPVNTTVTWMNVDSTPHTATADAGSAFQFDTGAISSGATSRAIAFTQPGTFTYFCGFHTTMRGTIIVQ